MAAAAKEKIKKKMESELGKPEEGAGGMRGMKWRRRKEQEEKKETFSPLLSVTERLPGVFEEGVLSKLNGTDLKFFTRASKGC